MAKQHDPTDGSWLAAEELLERGDPAFVDELRRIREAERLADFAWRWFTDRRPASRQLMLQYLAHPLNAFRHEPLVKRLFKLAEKAGDDVLMAHFLVAFDRSVRRVVRKRVHYDWSTRQVWTDEALAVPPGTVMPRDAKVFRFRNPRTGGRIAAPTPSKHDALRLFSVHTRNYLRRRARRYFRKLGETHPARYLPAMVEALQQYTDDDTPDGLALLDNWGLIHVLFHHSPALVARASGWSVAEGHRLDELAAAPAFEPLWRKSAESVVELLRTARCRVVRQWTIQMLRRHHPDAITRLPLRELLAMLVAEDPELSQLAAEALARSPELSSLRVKDWLKLVESANPQTLDLLCDLMTQRLKPEMLDLEQTVQLACSRPLPVARLGLLWLRAKKPATAEDCRLLLSLAEAEAAPLRPELIRWARSVLAASPHFEAAWVLELLDSRHEDVRREAWTWFLEDERTSREPMLWQRLLESPYDDIRLRLAVLLEEQASRGETAVDRSQLDAELTRFLWATVLLNVHRGSRVKPRVVGQMLLRLERRPQEAPQILPILAVALRSVRRPEWRAGLAAVVQLVERRPELEQLVEVLFPELKLGVL